MPHFRVTFGLNIGGMKKVPARMPEVIQPLDVPVSNCWDVTEPVTQDRNSVSLVFFFAPRKGPTHMHGPSFYNTPVIHACNDSSVNWAQVLQKSLSFRKSGHCEKDKEPTIVGFLSFGSPYLRKSVNITNKKRQKTRQAGTTASSLAVNFPRRSGSFTINDKSLAPLSLVVDCSNHIITSISLSISNQPSVTETVAGKMLKQF